MIDPAQFRALIIRPTLQGLGLGGLNVENLLLGTAMVESGLVYLHQLGSGPALGIYQMEPATHNDIWANWLNGQKALAQAVKAYMDLQSPLDQLAGNLYYATAMTRHHYRRLKDPLPDAADAAGLAQYHKRFYNTAGGATDVSHSVDLFRRAIATP